MDYKPKKSGPAQIESNHKWTAMVPSKTIYRSRDQKKSFRILKYRYITTIRFFGNRNLWSWLDTHYYTFVPYCTWISLFGLFVVSDLRPLIRVSYKPVQSMSVKNFNCLANLETLMTPETESFQRLTLIALALNSDMNFLLDMKSISP